MPHSAARYQFPMMQALTETITAPDWTGLAQSLGDLGHALTPPRLDATTCAALAASYHGDRQFRSTVTMARHGFGQPRPTPLLLRYCAGDYNCQHQVLYGPFHFPLQAAMMLSAQGSFTGGALTLVESRPRLQSRAEAGSIRQGQTALIPVRGKPRLASARWSKSAMRRGVSTVLSGERQTLGVVFHDAS